MYGALQDKVDPNPMPEAVTRLGHHGVVLLVILGAGASFNSAEEEDIDPARRQEINEWRPPLAKELFQSRSHFGRTLERYSDFCAGLVVELRAAVSVGRPLEQLLDEVLVRAQDDRRSATELMAIRYYLRQVIYSCTSNWLAMTHLATNYHFLVSRLDRWARQRDECVLYVTFNYDTLLEQACRQADLYVKDLDSYISHPRAKVFKPHGSTNWAHHISFDIPPNINDRDYVIRNASALDIPSGIEVRDDWQAGVRGQEWIPALAVPVERKLSFECPPKHMKALEELLPGVDRLLVIGWRATEENFLELLRTGGRKNVRRVLIACKSKPDSGQAWHRLEHAFAPDRSDMGFGDLWTAGMSNLENNLGFSDLVKQPTLIDDLVEDHPPLRVAAAR